MGSLEPFRSPQARAQFIEMYDAVMRNWPAAFEESDVATAFGSTSVTLVLRDGFVREEFIDLARTPNRTADQEIRLDLLKAQLAQALLSAPADQLYDVVG